MKKTIIILLIALSIGCQKQQMESLQGEWLQDDDITILDVSGNNLKMYRIGHNVPSFKGYYFEVKNSKIFIENYPMFNYQLIGNHLKLVRTSNKEVLKFKRLK